MTGIGIGLDDLGIETDSTYTPSWTQSDSGYPKEYDFTLDLHIHGSWRQMRRALYPVAEAAFRGGESPLLNFTLHWAGRDNETEESIKAALTGVKYGQTVHEAFENNLEDWAENQSDPSIIRSAMAATSGAEHPTFFQFLAMNECTPGDALQEIIKNSRARHSLLFNPTVGPQMVRDLYELIKDEPWAAAIVSRATTEVPAEILEQLAKGDYPSIEIPDQLVRRDNLTEQALVDLIGKCHQQDIRSHPACTDRVRREIDRLQTSGGALTPEDRTEANEVLKKIRSAIKSGRTGAIKRRGGAELVVLNAVCAKPELGLGVVSRILDEDRF